MNLPILGLGQVDLEFDPRFEFVKRIGKVLEGNPPPIDEDGGRAIDTETAALPLFFFYLEAGLFRVQILGETKDCSECRSLVKRSISNSSWPA